MDLAIDVQALAAEVSKADRRRAHSRMGFPAELRDRVVRYAAECREQGETLLDIGVRLGLRESTLSRWLRRRATEAAPSAERASIGRLLPVAVSTDRAASDRVDPGHGSLRLVTPNGYVVEGLELAQLARLLEVLG